MTLPIPTEAAVRQSLRASGPTRLTHALMLGFAVQSRDLSAPSALLERCVTVSPIVNPVLDELAKAAGLERSSPRSYRGDLRRLSPDLLLRFFQAIPGRALLPPSALKADSLASFSRQVANRELRALFSSHPLLTPLSALDFKGSTQGVYALVRLSSTLRVDFVTEGFASSLGADLDLFTRRSASSRRLIPSEALSLASKALEAKIPVLDVGHPPRLRTLEAFMSASVAVAARPGYPCVVDVTAGMDTDLTSQTLGPVGALSLVARIHQELPVAVDPTVVEFTDMELAAPLSRPGLFPYQDQFVSTYLASSSGLVCALSPGMGKTVSAAVALEEASRPGSIAIVVASKVLHSQWVSELNRWAPSLSVIPLSSAEAFEKAFTPSELSRALVISPELLSRIPLDEPVEFDELVVDEARSVSSASKVNKSLATLRRGAKRAMVLTGTPAERDLSEVAHLAALARSDKALLTDVKKNSYDPARLGPVFFSRSSGEVSSSTPSLDVSFVDLDMEDPLKELYRKVLDEVIRRRDLLLAARARSDGRAANSARTSLVAALNLLRQCVSDPSGLLRSSSPFAASLVASSTVGPALSSTARLEAAVSIVSDELSTGPALVFSDFVASCDAFTARAQFEGLRAEALTGAHDAFERTLICASFASGELDVLAVASSAQRGLNLQAASTLVHLDLPLSATEVAQRTGRVVRIGSAHSAVTSHVISYRRTSDVVLRDLFASAFSSVDQDSLTVAFSDEASILDFVQMLVAAF